MVRIQLFLHQKKIGLIQETKNSSYCSVVALTKTERSSKLVVGNVDRPMHKLQCNPQNKFQLSTFELFLFISWEDKDKESPFFVKLSFSRFHTVSKKTNTCVKVFLRWTHCIVSFGKRNGSNFGVKSFYDPSLNTCFLAKKKAVLL